MSCPCDRPPFPRPLAIPPGLTRITRQIADFPQLRQALLASVGSARHAAALGRWHADGPNDLGVMLIEMWAYLGDTLAFYDEVHAHECYLRTARLAESARALVERLGYRPRPAVAALVELALLADGRVALAVPATTAFRSAAFGTEKPQVFETDAEATIHPLLSRWALAAPRPVVAGDPGGPGAVASTLRLDPARSAKWATGDRVLVQPRPDTATTWQVRTVTAADAVTADDGTKWLDLTISSPALTLGAATPLAGVRLLRPAKQAGLWIQPDILAVSEVLSGTDFTSPTALVLDAVYRDLRPGALVLVSCTAPGREGQRWFRVTAATEITVSVPMATDADGNTISGWLPATQITLDIDIDSPARGSTDFWGDTDAAHLLVHYDLRDAGRLGAPAQPTLAPGVPLRIEPPLPTPLGATPPTRFVLQDVDGRAVALGGSLDIGERRIDAASYDTPRPPLTLPAHAYANLITASRGETVAREVLGSGDANLASLSFRLKKSPLTYVPAATAADGYASTLRVWVDGVLWSERPTFYGAGAEDRVYVVRVDADGVAEVSFGGGARLPTGVGNVVASYRHGAGAAAPPAGSIGQIARGVAGLRAVRQPFAAYGGADAEGPETLREGAPRQTLTLGRAVSIRDMEAFAAACNGLRAVAVGWAWDALGLRPVVQVWVVGEGDIGDTVQARLLAVSDPTTPITVAAAAPVPIALALEVRTDPARVGAEVEAAVAAALLDAPSGLLSIEQLGIGKPFYFSRLAEAVHRVDGVVSMQSTWRRDGVVATGYGDFPGPGAYFDLSAGVVLNGKVQAYAG